MSQPLLIAGGTVYDGSGAPPTASDVLVRDGTIAAIAPRGTLSDVADARRIDATDRWVTPGFIDNHTHYDAEVALGARMA